MPGELERTLAELSARLGLLGPTLDRLEARQHEQQDKITRLEERVRVLQEQTGIKEGQTWDVKQIVISAVVAGLVGYAVSMLTK